MSMRSVGNDCVGCERCVNCGRKNGYVVYECDKCGAEIDPEEECLYELDGKEVCLKCYALAKAKDWIAEMFGRDESFMEVLINYADADAIDLGAEEVEE